MIFRGIALTFLPVFSFSAIYLNWGEGPFRFEGPLWPVKALIWVSFALFSAYSGYCTVREDLFETIQKVTRWHFGRQICLDLYVGLGLMLFLMFLNEPTVLGFLAWMIPTLFYVNLLSLLYFAIHFDSIVAKFLVLVS